MLNVEFFQHESDFSNNIRGFQINLCFEHENDISKLFFQLKPNFYWNVLKLHEKKLSDLCEFKNQSNNEHTNFVQKAHKTEWFEDQLDRCLNKTRDAQTGQSHHEPDRSLEIPGLDNWSVFEIKFW